MNTWLVTESVASRSITRRPVLGAWVLGAIYVASGYLGLSLVPALWSSVTPFWPPTGVALPLLFVYGYGYWPIILIGATLVASAYGMDYLMAFVCGLSNTASACLGTGLLQRYTNLTTAFEGRWNVLGFVALAALVATAVGATLGVVGAWLVGALPQQEIVFNWWVWWLGDSAGVLMISPALMVWQSCASKKWHRRQLLEFVALVSTLVVVSAMVFGKWLSPPAAHPPEYIFFPFVVWGALRLGQRGTALLTFLSAIIVTVYWYLDTGGQFSAQEIDRLLQLQAFLCVLAVTGMVLAATVDESRVAMEAADARSEALAKAIAFCKSEPDLDDYLGHMLKVVVDETIGIGGVLWLPETQDNTVRLHLEYRDGRIIDAAKSQHPVAGKVLSLTGDQLVLTPVESRKGELYVRGDGRIPESIWRYLLDQGASSLLVLPLWLRDRPMGWLNVRGRATDADGTRSALSFAEAFAGQAALAMELAALRQQAEGSAVLVERQRIARDIHDTLAQGFAGIILHLRAAKSDITDSRVAALASRLTAALELAQSSLDEARVSLGILRKPESPRAEFRRDLEQVSAHATNGTAISIDIDQSGNPFELPGSAHAELLRVAQEAMTNTIKHANASRINIMLRYSASGFALTVADDGVGFDTHMEVDGFGLVGMRERAERAGGMLTICSQPGVGTSIIVTLPVDEG